MTGKLRHPAWRKSSYSTSQANCVEVALGGPAIGVRDSKGSDGPVLPVQSGCWRSSCAGSPRVSSTAERTLTPVT
jgi:hypothetical protein